MREAAVLAAALNVYGKARADLWLAVVVCMADAQDVYKGNRRFFVVLPRLHNLLMAGDDPGSLSVHFNKGDP